MRGDGIPGVFVYGAIQPAKGFIVIIERDEDACDPLAGDVTPVRFIDQLLQHALCFTDPAEPGMKQFGDPSERYCSDDCSEANPTPPEWSKRQKPEAITQGSKSAKDEKWSCEAAVNATATGGVEQTRNAHDRERRSPQNHSQPRRLAKAERESNPRRTPKKPR